MTQFNNKNCVFILTKILLCRIIKLSEVICMKTYCFTVVGNPSYFRSIYIRSKTLKDAVSLLQELLSREFSGEYRISQFYTLISNGKKSFRSMSKVIRGVA